MKKRVKKEKKKRKERKEKIFHKKQRGWKVLKKEKKKTEENKRRRKEKLWKQNLKDRHSDMITQSNALGSSTIHQSAIHLYRAYCHICSYFGLQFFFSQTAISAARSPALKKRNYKQQCTANVILLALLLRKSPLLQPITEDVTLLHRIAIISTYIYHII